MMRLFNILFYVIVVLGAYVLAFNEYAPSDVTLGLWLKKPKVLMAIGAVVGLFIIKRVLGIVLFADKLDKARQLVGTFLLLPFYAFISLFIVININGYFDDGSRTVVVPTNLVLFKDMKIACITAAIDDKQLQAGERTPMILFVPRRMCQNINKDVGNGKKHPYILMLSGGRLGIPYLADIVKDHSGS